MTSCRRTLLRSLAGLLACLLAAGLPAGETPPALSPRPPTLPELPPRPPPPASPVDRFRQLLEMSAAEREAFLAARPPEKREYLRARLAEFDALPPEERELRLHLLNLRFYLLPLLRLEPAQRAEALRQVPRAYRPLVTDRLATWDRLPADQHEAWLAGGALFVRQPLLSENAAAGPAATNRATSSPPGDPLAADLARWEALPAAERARISGQLAAFLAFSPEEQQRVLGRLDADRREPAQRLVRMLESQSPAERARRLEALQRLANLSPEQRQRFLQNAARWQALSEAEKEAWRRLHTLLPPRPPDLPPALPRPSAAPAGAPPLAGTNPASPARP